jgi:hypothetical protein
MAKNLCAKLVTPENAYEVWQTNDGWFTTYVLRKYKSSDAEENDPVARWYVCTTTPNNPKGEYGDSYVTHVKASAKRLWTNPLTGKDIPPIIDWDKRVPVVWLSLMDLKDAGFTEQQIAEITDKDLFRIASRLEDSLRDDNWEEQVYIQATMVLELDVPVVGEGNETR